MAKVITEVRKMLSTVPYLQKIRSYKYKEIFKGYILFIYLFINTIFIWDSCIRNSISFVEGTHSFLL